MFFASRGKCVFNNSVPIRYFLCGLQASLEDEPPGQKVSSMLLGKNRGQLLIAPERMKQLCQGGNDTQVWISLVMKIKSNAVKNCIA